MKIAILIIIFLKILFISVGAPAQNSPVYYVKADGGSGDGLSESTAWNLTTLNQARLPAGAVVLFRRGDTFNGTLSVRSGSVGQPITYAAYGNGANPIISGFKTISSWFPVGNNTFCTEIDVPELNIINVDGKLKSMGRYPRTGYLTFTSHQGNNSITSALDLPFNPTGCEVVIRKIRQVTDRHVITGYANKTISLSSSGGYNTVYLNNTSYQPQDGNGFFIQACLYTLSQLGDWYYDKPGRRLYMYFGTSSPEQHQVQIATIATLVQLNNISDVSFQNLTFEGANREVININNGNRFTFSNCELRLSYGGIAADNGMNQLQVQGGSMSQLANSGIYIPQSSYGTVISGLTMNSIGTIAGAGGSGDATQLGIWIQGDNSTVTGCTLNNIGYHGIVLYGNNSLIEKNSIANFGLVKDDCGGIYEFQFKGVTHTNKIIRQNVILNPIGVPEGAPSYAPYGQAAGIYLDANVNHVSVDNNTLANGPWGGILLVGVGAANSITRNLTYNFAQGLLMQSFSDQPLRNLSVSNNTFIAKTGQQATLCWQAYAPDSPTNLGFFNQNRYARPLDDNATIVIDQQYAGGAANQSLSLARWQSQSGQDASSTHSVLTVDQVDKLRFDYNATSVEQTISLDRTYSDLANTYSTTALRLSPYSGSVLVNVNKQDAKPSDCSASGLILYEHWENVPGTTIQDIPVQKKPSWTGLPPSLEGPVNFADNYASRMRGYICAPQTGNYTFWLAGDDASELWLSTDDNPLHKVRIAWVDGWTYFRQWDKYTSQQSVSVPLVAGQRYYVEALHKEGGGDDNVSVRWQLPSGVIETPLPGRYLSPYLGDSQANSRLMPMETGESLSGSVLSVYPNPFSAETTVEFGLDESSPATLRLYNANGQLVQRLFEGTVEAQARQRVLTTGNGLPAGLYLMELIGGKQRLVKKVIISH